MACGSRSAAPGVRFLARSARQEPPAEWRRAASAGSEALTEKHVALRVRDRRQVTPVARGAVLRHGVSTVSRL